MGISTHAPRTGSDRSFRLWQQSGESISTHAPRTGSDCFSPRLIMRLSISTHAPRTGSDPKGLSTSRGSQRHFNPRSPHGERLHIGDSKTMKKSFQPTLPARGATPQTLMDFTPVPFQPTLPARGATDEEEETRILKPHFNPRSPHGERLTRAFQFCKVLQFQPTLPARGATISSSRALRLQTFQPTLPARGAT